MKIKSFDNNAQATSYFNKLSKNENLDFCAKYLDAETGRWECMWSYKKRAAAAN